MIFLLKKTREQHGLTQRALSKRSGVLQGFISEIEAGNKKPSLETAYRLAQALGVKVDDLIQPDK
ncbi:MAG: helix-turn-helix transcriptional regulator [Bacilli bacterium]